jgi:hypothetical protein
MALIKGLTEIKVGTAALDGTEPATLTKIGKVYKESLEIVQDDPEITEFFEEGQLFPEDSTEEGKPIYLKGELFADDTTLPLIGGAVTSGDWEINESKTTTQYVKFITKQGKDFHAPNCKIIAKLLGKLTGKDVVRVGVIFKPQAVTSPAKAFRAEAKV